MDIDAARWARIDAVLDAALDLPPAERTYFVARTCAGNPTLAQEVQALLAADERAGAFLDPPSAEHLDGLLRDDKAGGTFTPGRVIGAYRLTGVVGEGGMGVVYDAERADGQFESRVALKVLRWTGASDDARRRFLRERQILARLEHPHIARLLDGGVTDDGLPYFVMERVMPGLPLTAWCEDATLDVDARLALVLQACDAVQYAHRQLVVHRDLKPTNIVVDAAGAVKLLDFGIAKLLDDDDAPAATRADARPMTPAYAAPEQVAGQPITTATDVYALGVVLYQVLTGRLPYDVATGRVTDWARAVLDTTPMRPSVAVAVPGRASRLRGDLDRIVLKALEKEPARRYSSVEAFADDLRRHLTGLPVNAHEASRWYRARKFIRRNRLLAGGVAATMLALALGLGATTWQARKARAEARRASAVQAFLVSVFEQADPDQAKGRELTAKAILDRGAQRIEREFAAQPDVRYALWDTLHDLYQKLGDYSAGVAASRQQVEAALAGFGANSFEHGRALRRLASALAEAEDAAAGAEPLARAMPIIRATAGEQSEEMIEALNTLGAVELAAGRRQSGIDAYRRALAAARTTYGPDAEGTARVENDLVVALGDGDEALALAHHVSAVYRRSQDGQSYMLTIALYNEGNQLYASGRWADAARVFDELVPIQEQWLGPTHTKTVLTYRQLARLAAAAGNFDRARVLMAKAIAGLEAEFGPQSASVALALGQLANIERLSGRYAEGLAAGRRALGAIGDAADMPSNRALVLDSVAATWLGAGDAAEALRAADEALRISSGADKRWLGSNLFQRGAALVRLGRRIEAVPVLRTALDRMREAGQGQSVACAGALRWLADAGIGTMTGSARDAYYRESLALFAAVAPAEQGDALDAHVAFAAFLVESGRSGEATAHVTAVLAAFERSTGLDPARQVAANTLARALPAGQ